MKKIIIADEIFDKTLAYQPFWKGETFGGKVIEIEDEYYFDCVREDFDGYTFNLDKYTARKKREFAERKKLYYEDAIVSKIREKYTVNEELAILRQRDSKPEEFAEYNDYVELCKIQVKESMEETQI